MAIIPRIIYCGRSNKQLDRIATTLGFEYGLRLPFTAHYKPVFADQNWNAPVRDKYMAAVKLHQPEIATVLDWERQDQKDEVFSWANEIADYVKVVVIIPKFIGAISQIPETIKDKPIRLGYSVPTEHGSTPVKVVEFEQRPVHLLGGQPQTQMMLYRRMNVQSVDCNYHSMKANKVCEGWTGKMNGHTRMWIPMSHIGVLGENSTLISFAISCGNIMRAWHMVAAGEILPFENQKMYRKQADSL